MLFIKIRGRGFKLLVFGQLVQCFFQLRDFFGRSLFVAFKVRALKEPEARKQFCDLLITYALVHLVEEAEVLVQGGHELGQGRAFQLGRAFAVADHHAFGGFLDHHAHELAIVLDVLLRLAFLDAIKRRLGNENVTAFDQLVHVAEEKREQQGANVAQHLVVAGLFHVQDLAFERQNGLEAAVASLLGGAAGGFTFDQEQFATVRIALGAVGEFAGKTAAIQSAFATREIAGFARCFAGTRGFNRFVDDLARHRRVLLKERAQALVDECLHGAGNVGIQLGFGLAFKLRLRQLDTDHGHQAFTNVVTRKVFFYIFEKPELLAGIVDGPGKRSAETGKMRAAVHGVDVVGETENCFGVAVVVLE